MSRARCVFRGHSWVPFLGFSRTYRCEQCGTKKDFVQQRQQTKKDGQPVPAWSPGSITWETGDWLPRPKG